MISETEHLQAKFIKILCKSNHKIKIKKHILNSNACSMDGTQVFVGVIFFYYIDFFAQLNLSLHLHCGNSSYL